MGGMATPVAGGTPVMGGGDGPFIRHDYGAYGNLLKSGGLKHYALTGSRAVNFFVDKYAIDTPEVARFKEGLGPDVDFYHLLPKEKFPPSMVGKYRNADSIKAGWGKNLRLKKDIVMYEPDQAMAETPRHLVPNFDLLNTPLNGRDNVQVLTGLAPHEHLPVVHPEYLRNEYSIADRGGDQVKMAKDALKVSVMDQVMEHFEADPALANYGSMALPLD
jgi:hypothetical protein